MSVEIQTIQSVGNDIITCTKERATILVNDIMENNAKGIDLYFNNCELIKELRDGNGYYQLGYSNFKEFAEAVFDSGETQAKNMCLIAKYFGKENTDKSWTIIDKELLKSFSATQLLYIGQLKNFKGNITEAVQFYGFSIEKKNGKDVCTTTTKVLRELVQFEKNHNKALSLAQVDELKNKLPDNDPKDNDPKDNEPKDNEPKDNEPKDNEPKDNEPKGETVSKAQFDEAKKERDNYILQLTEVEKIVFDDNKTDKQKIELLKKAFNNLKSVNNQ